MANREAFGRALVKLGEQNHRVVVFDSDVCTSTRTCLFQDAFPERFFQMGVAEQNMVSAAAGMSTVGSLIPWVSTFAVFASKRALDQVSISIAYPRNNVKINGSYGGIPTGKAGATHQAVQDIAIMRSMPNMTVIVPLDAVEVEQAVFTYRFQWGKAVLLRQGSDVTLMVTGVMTELALQGAEALEREGIDARVLHIHTIKPIDREAIIGAAGETRGIVTVENHSYIGGLGGAVSEVLTD
jgi:transketolase